MTNEIALLRGGFDNETLVATIEDELRGPQRLVVSRENAVILSEEKLRDAIAERLAHTYYRGGDFAACADAALRLIAVWGQGVTVRS